MRADARVQAAIDLLGKILAGADPADRAVFSFFRARRYAGAKDRAAIAERVYNILRHRAELLWRLGGAGVARPSPRDLCFGALVLLEETPANELEALFTGEGHGPKQLDDAERHRFDDLVRQPSVGEVPAWVRGNYPAWLEAPLRARFGAALDEEAAAFARRAPLDLRVNTLRTDRAGALAALDVIGITAAPTPYSPLGLRLEASGSVTRTEAYRRGLFEIQDEGAQIVALLVGADTGQQVVDLCAGAGGKSLALAAVLQNRGQIYACDIDRRRLGRMQRRLVRAGTRNVQLHRLGGADDPWYANHEGTAHRVLVDAPCSGAGTWRRNPDVLWRLSPDSLASHNAAQLKILDAAAPLVRPGGRLIYATCSIFAQENEEVVTAFLAGAAEFTPVPIAVVWAQTLDGDCPAEGDYLTLSPARHGTDGFFVAILERAR